MWRLPRQAVLSVWKCETLQCRKTTNSTNNGVVLPFSISAQSDHALNNLLSVRKSFERSYSNFGDKRDHNSHKKHTFWNGRHFHCNHFSSSFFEAVSWVGTAVVLGLNIQHKVFPTLRHSHEDCNDHLHHAHSSVSHALYCGLSGLVPRLAFTMPKTMFSIRNNVLPENPPLVTEESLKNEPYNNKEKVCSGLEDARQELEVAATTCLAQLENLTALQLIKDSPKQAIKYFKAAGELGSSQAHFNLGVCHETGKGTKVDLEKAAKHYQLAAKGGHILATYNLGVYFWEGKGGLEKNPEIALQLIQQAARQGMAMAQVFMGLHYYEKEEMAEAIVNFTNAAEQKNTDAQYYLATCHESGLGVPVDLEKASELYTAAASKGHKEAMYSLACFYEEGLGGLPQDVKYAATLYKRASDAGHLEAEAALYQLEEKLKSNSSVSDGSPPEERSDKNKAHPYNHNTRAKHNSLHISSSSPDLGLLDSSSNSNGVSPDSTTQYLNLIFPAIFEQCMQKKVSLYEEKEDANVDVSQLRTPWPNSLRLLAANT